jgi:translation elongation factor EF-G
VATIVVQPKIVSDLPKLVEGLERLVKPDPCVQIRHEITGEHIMAVAFRNVP